MARTVVSIDSLVAVGKGGDLPDVLVVLLGKCLLGVRVAVVVDHAFDVAGGDGAKTQGPQIAQQGHRDAGFVAIRVRENDAGFDRP